MVKTVGTDLLEKWKEVVDEATAMRKLKSILSYRRKASEMRQRAKENSGACLSSDSWTGSRHAFVADTRFSYCLACSDIERNAMLPLSQPLSWVGILVHRMLPIIFFIIWGSRVLQQVCLCEIWSQLSTYKSNNL